MQRLARELHEKHRKPLSIIDPYDGRSFSSGRCVQLPTVLHDVINIFQTTISRCIQIPLATISMHPEKNIINHQSFDRRLHRPESSPSIVIFDDGFVSLPVERPPRVPKSPHTKPGIATKFDKTHNAKSKSLHAKELKLAIPERGYVMTIAGAGATAPLESANHVRIATMRRRPMKRSGTLFA